MKKFFVSLLILIVIICAFNVIRRYTNRDYQSVSTITYSAGSSSDWAYGNQRKEFSAGGACYARIGDCIYTDKKNNVGNKIKVTYSFTTEGDITIDLSEGKAERVNSKDDKVVKFTRVIAAQSTSNSAEDVIIFRYVSKTQGSISLEVTYDYHIRDEYDLQSTIYFIE